MAPGKRRDDLGAVSEQGFAAFVSGLDAGQEQQLRRVGRGAPVGVRDQPGPGKRRISRRAGPGVGDLGDAIGSRVAVGPDRHQLTGERGQRGAAGDAGQDRQPVLAELSRDTGLPAGAGVACAEGIHLLSLR
jgi:hypothetical protein